MITDKIENLFKYAALFPEIAQLEQFRTIDQLQAIQEKTSFQDLTIIPIKSEVNPEFDEQLLEAHQKLMDIHITLEGTDCMAYACLQSETSLVKDYDPVNDYLLAKSSSVKKIMIPVGYFCIVPNHFAHMALYGIGEGVKKVVVKLPANSGIE